MKPELKREHSFTIVRVINTSANELYAGWTEPPILKRWLAPLIDADVRVGGSYRLSFPASDSGAFELVGTYEILQQGHLIIQSFRNTAHPADAFTDERLEIRMDPQGSLTKQTLTLSWNGRARTADEISALEAEWKRRLDRLCSGVELPSTQDA